MFHSYTPLELNKICENCDLYLKVTIFEYSVSINSTATPLPHFSAKTIMSLRECLYDQNMFPSLDNCIPPTFWRKHQIFFTRVQFSIVYANPVLYFFNLWFIYYYFITLLIILLFIYFVWYVTLSKYKLVT